MKKSWFCPEFNYILSEKGRWIEESRERGVYNVVKKASTARDAIIVVATKNIKKHERLIYQRDIKKRIGCNICNEPAEWKCEQGCPVFYCEKT